MKINDRTPFYYPANCEAARKIAKMKRSVQREWQTKGLEIDVPEAEFFRGWIWGKHKLPVQIIAEGEKE